MAKLELLREDQIAKRFRSLNRGQSVKIAVPFWGESAETFLGLKSVGSARIVCNLSSAGCNPYAIRKIAELLKKGSVRTHPALHAKLYLTDTTAIVGSSNVSSGGMLELSDSRKSWIEANVLSDDKGFRSECIHLFNRIWQESKAVTPAMLAKEIKRWDERPTFRTPLPPRSMSLIESLRYNPTFFKHVYLYVYDELLGDEGEEQLKSVRSSAVDSVKRRQAGKEWSAASFRNAWGYQPSATTRGKLTKGSYLIDISLVKKPKVCGSAEVTGLVLPCKKEDDLLIALPAKTIPANGGVSVALSASDKTALLSISKQVMDSGNVMSLASAAKLLKLNQS